MSASFLEGEPGGVSRRALLMGGGAALMLAACGGHGEGAPAAGNTSDVATSPQSEPVVDPELAKRLTTAFEDGITGDWLYAGVFPGLAVVHSSVSLHTSPITTAANVIKPANQGYYNLLVQRPFMVQQTLEANGVINNQAEKIGDEVMGFWLPDSNRLAYFDRAAFKGSIMMASNSGAAIYENNFKDFTGEVVTLQPTAHAKGKVWRYLLTERVNSKEDLSELTYEDTHGYGNVTQVVKVVGRSQWANPSYAASSVYAFETGNTDEGGDIVVLPKELRP